MNILQVEFKNRSGYILRGIVTLPNTQGPVPLWCIYMALAVIAVAIDL